MTFTSDAVAVRTFYELGGHSLLPDVVSVELSVNKLVETHSVDGMECDFSVLVTTRWYGGYATRLFAPESEI